MKEPPDQSNDDALLHAIEAGDERSATVLHDRLRPRIEWTVRALLGAHHTEREDLVQQSFVEIVLSLHRYRGECSLETWAATITARTTFKYLRRRTIERRVFSGEELDPESSSPISVKRQVVVRDLATRIRRHLEEMDEGKAEAFLLHDVCGFEAREVAATLGISESAAHARIARGRRELHQRLAADPELSEPLFDMELYG